MRVLAAIIVPPHLSVSGGARAGEQLSSALAGRCSLDVASMMGGPEDGDPLVRRLPVRTWLPPVLPWGALSHRHATLFYRSSIPDLVRSGRYDLVHLHNPMPALEMARVARACRAAEVPYVVSTHGFNEIGRGHEIYGFGTAKRLAWRKLAYEPVAQVARGAAAVFALSPADRPILDAMGASGDDAHLVPNGVATPDPPDVKHDRALYARLGIPPERTDGRLTCLFLANHTPNKGLPVLFAAFRALDCPFRLIVGGERRPEIDYATPAAGLGPGQEIVVTGRLADREIPALMRRSDVFVFPTLADTLPLVVLEAMAHGLPVVASDVGGIPYQLAEDAGVLVPAGDAAALAAAVGALADDPARRARMAESARNRVLREFTWEAAAERAMEGYERTLAASRGRQPSRARRPPSLKGAVPAGGRRG